MPDTPLRDTSGGEPAQGSPPPAPPEPDGPHGTEHEPAPTTRVQLGDHAEIDQFRVDQRRIATVIENQVVQLYHTRTTVRRFSCADAQPVPAGWEAASAVSFRGADGEVRELLQHLEERRVLVLSAERGAGKVRTAVYLGARLRQRGACAETLVAEALERSVRVDVRHLAARDAAVANRLVVFPNAFSRADSEVARFFETTDRDGWQQVAGQLRARGAYLLFTADPADAAAAGASGVRRALAPHPSELLAAELDERLAGLHDDDHGRVEALREARGWMLETFRYVPQLLDFVDNYVELEPPVAAPAEAWRRMRSAGSRILQDLDGDFEGWSFAFTLALAQCGGESEGVPWLDVDRLHRLVRQWLRRDLNLRYPDAEGPDAEADADTRLEVSDARLLKRVRAEVDAGGLAHTVRFRDAVPPGELWRTMLSDHRRALLTVLPGLRALAERGDAELGSLRVLAARIVGRIGEMDPHRVTLPALDRWAASELPHRQGAVGAVLDGAMASGSPRYRAACIEHLQALQRAASDGAEGSLTAVIAAWSWVGDHDLPAAMRALGAVVREHLVPWTEDDERVRRALTRLENVARQHGRKVAAAALRTRVAILRALASEPNVERAGRFLEHLLAVQFALALLSAARGPVPVLTEMRRWIAEGGWKTGAVVALLFLEEDGIADRLGAWSGGSNAEGAAPSRNLLVEALLEGDDAVRLTARFLGEVGEALRTPFAADSALQETAMQNLQAHLADWARGALPVPEHAAAVGALFHALASTHDGILREPLAALLAGPEFAGDPRMRAFAASVRL